MGAGSHLPSLCNWGILGANPRPGRPRTVVIASLTLITGGGALGHRRSPESCLPGAGQPASMQQRMPFG